MGDKSRKARRGKSKRGGRRQKTEEATNEMSDREKIKCKVCWQRIVCHVKCCALFVSGEIFG